MSAEAERSVRTRVTGARQNNSRVGVLSLACIDNLASVHVYLWLAGSERTGQRCCPTPLPPTSVFQGADIHCTWHVAYPLMQFPDLG
jgi:hypothetical protein